MRKIVSYVLGAGRITSIIGLVIGAPGVYDAVQAFLAGHQISFRGLVTSIAAVLLGRFAAQEKGTQTGPSGQN